MSQAFSVYGFKWIEKKSQFSKDCKEKCNEDSDTGYFIEADVKYPEKLHELHSNLTIFV